MQAMQFDRSARSLLVVRIGSRVCGIPVEAAVEVMRPLPIERMTTSARAVLGLAIIRGEPVPVVDLGTLLGAPTIEGTRFAVVRAGDRRVALLVDSIVGIRSVAPTELSALPPLIGGDHGDVITAVGRLDADLLLVLSAAYLLPEGAP